jgi:hypothetical protein
MRKRIVMQAWQTDGLVPPGEELLSPIFYCDIITGTKRVGIAGKLHTPPAASEFPISYM